jgi:large subunit ribosomal protein L9
MRVLLIKDVPGIGRAGDIKEVSDGHARNFLIPRGLGLPASDSAVKKVQKEKQEKQDKTKREQEKLNNLTKELNKVRLTLTGKAGKEHLFAAIKPEDISRAVYQNYQIELDPKLIIIETPIKTLGHHTASVKITPEHKALINIEVKAQSQ